MSSAGMWLVLVAAAAGVQAPPPAGLRSYEIARRVLDQGVTALGGPEALREVRTVRRELAGGWAGSGQSRRPWLAMSDGASPPYHERDELSSFLDYGRNRWFESLKYFLISNAAEYVVQIEVGTESEAFQSLAYIDERPFYQQFAAEDVIGLRSGKFRRFPEGLLRTALDRPETLQWIGTSSESGNDQEVISFADPTGTRILLYFDAQTHLLTKSETLREHPLAGDTSSEALYSDYRKVGKLRLPYRYVERVAGVPTQDLRAAVIELNASIPDERFQPPREFVEIEQHPPQPTLHKVGDGLYLIRGSYNVMFAVFRDYVLVIEAPLSSHYAEACLKLIRATAPAKPIRLVATHFHFDHIAGVRPYIAEGVAILTTADAKPIIERVAASHRTLHPDALSRNPRAPTIETLSSRTIFDDGIQRVEIHDFGPTNHVEQLLVAYFPREKLLYQADLWDVPSQVFAVAGADTAIMARKIEALGLQVERIIPTHGVPATSELLTKALAIREKVSGLFSANRVRYLTPIGENKPASNSGMDSSV